jgi:cytochrome c oxidase subunit 2
MSIVGPNLTHVASRHTIAAGIYPNDDRHLARWIKNAGTMKPGALMNAQGTGEFDRVTKGPARPGYTDAQIADLVAFLRALK